MNEKEPRTVDEKEIPKAELASGLRDYGTDLDALAREWAINALETYQGETLRKALDISAAIANFHIELTK